MRVFKFFRVSSSSFKSSKDDLVSDEKHSLGGGKFKETAKNRPKKPVRRSPSSVDDWIVKSSPKDSLILNVAHQNLYPHLSGNVYERVFASNNVDAITKLAFDGPKASGRLPGGPSNNRESNDGQNITFNDRCTLCKPIYGKRSDHKAKDERRSERHKFAGRNSSGSRRNVKTRSEKIAVNDKIGWEFKDVTLTRVPRFGFGIAVSGGRDNPHFPNGDPAIAISDVLKAGPAEGKLQVNDRVISANGMSLEGVDYSTAVQVLRECGNSVKLLIKRRVIFPPYDLIKVTLTKKNKKDDFGLVLGCRLFVKEITNRSSIEKSSSIAEGDVIVKINDTSTDNLSLKEAKKLIASSKERLNLVVKREQNAQHENASEATNRYPNQFSNSFKENSFAGDVSSTRPNWSNQNVYVQPPTRGDLARMVAPSEENKSNMMRLHQQMLQNGGGRHRGPITDISSLTQLDQPPTPVGSIAQSANGQTQPRSALIENGSLDLSAPPRPPPPRSSNVNTPTKSSYQDSKSSPLLPNMRSRPITSEPRLVSFKKDGSVGIRLTGGNEVGIFVSAVQLASPASLQGLQTGDKILKVNHTDMRGMTREEAVLYLLSVQDQIDLVVQHRKEEYEEVVAKQKGDSFHIRTHFKYDGLSKGELDFQAGEVFHVVDTLHNDMVGSWLVFRVSRKSEIQKGVIPNRSRAEEIAAGQSSDKSGKKEDSASNSSRGGFFRRRSARRSKSLTRDPFEDANSESMPKFPPYERVTLKHPGFIRPVVLFGPLADIARDKLLKDYPDKYECPQLLNSGHDDMMPKNGATSLKSGSTSSIAQCSSIGVVRLSAIRETIEKGKHSLLDLNPSAVDRLNYAQFAPIVIFLRAESKSIVKELRSRYSTATQVKSTRKLYESSVKLEKMYSHLFTSVITLGSAEMWYKKLRETIEKQQQISIWMSESKPAESIGDDFLFPMTSRLSYASSPESDLDLNQDTKAEKELGPRLVKASSDPSIATIEEMQPNVFGPPPYDRGRPMRQELNQGYDLHQTYANEKEAMEREDYFSSMKDPYNSMYPKEKYSNTSPDNLMQGIYNIGPSPLENGTPVTLNGPEPPPRIDRANKPNRFRSATEKLFPLPEDHDDNPPDYINTSMALPNSMNPPNSTSAKNASQPPLLSDHHPVMVNGRQFMDNSSYSSDSYKYGSPSSTLDDRRYGSLASSANSTLIINSRPMQERYHRNCVQQQMTDMVSGVKQPPTEHIEQLSVGKSPIENCRPPPPSPPPKPSNYQALRMNDSRPIPPPKPMHYSFTRPWRPEMEMNIEPPIHNQMNGGINSFQSPQRNSSSNLDCGPPTYYSTTMEQQQISASRSTGIITPREAQEAQASYVNHSSLSPVSRRISYSQNDNSNYMIRQNLNYEMRSPYNSKPPSRPLMNGGGPYLNVPPPRHRDSMSQHQPISTASQPSQPVYQSSSPAQSQPNHLDLSSNRENRGSAFELYRKPSDAVSPLARPNYSFHGLPPPPPSPPLMTEHENSKRYSYVSNDSNQNVVATAKGLFDYFGGTLSSEETKVSLVIPEGAIPEGVQQELYFKVCDNTSVFPPLDKEKDETLLSPIVMCGPHGVKFNVPVELRLPHCASVDSESSTFSLKLGDTPNGQPVRWQNVSLDDNDRITARSIEGNYLSVLLDHF